MRTPLVIVIAVVIAILAFLVFYSQQRDATTQAQQGISAETPAPGGAGPAHPAGEK